MPAPTAGAAHHGRTQVSAVNPGPQTAGASSLKDRPLQIVTACRARDLPVLEIAARKLPETVPFRALVVVAPDRDCRAMASRLGQRATIIPENGFIPGMTLDELRTLNLPGFPKCAGWYFQQLLKFQFAFVEPDDDYYLIWDADTVPLRPMRFFDERGRMLLTRATEYHPPYFETYRRLFGSDPNRECSFIAQHMLVQKSVAREMLREIETRIPGERNWAWKIMQTLPTAGNNLFSEYETYGHYIKNRYPERIAIIVRSWQREITHYTGRAVPSAAELAKLGQSFDYVAFERVYTGGMRWIKLLQNLLRSAPTNPQLPGE